MLILPGRIIPDSADLNQSKSSFFLTVKGSFVCDRIGLLDKKARAQTPKYENQ